MLGWIPTRLARVVAAACVPVRTVVWRTATVARIVPTFAARARGDVVRVEYIETIKHPAAEIFAAVADVETMPRWNPRLTRARRLTPGAVCAGTRFRIAAKGIGQADMEISEYEEPTRLHLRTSTGMADATHLYVLRPEGDGTRVEQIGQAHLKGLARIMAPVMGTVMTRTLRGDTERLKAYLTGQASSG